MATIGKTSSGVDVTIDLDRLLETRLLIECNSGGGKSWTLRKILEETHGQVQHLIFDLEGEFHTLREKYDYLLVGKDGDIQADTKTAEMLAKKLLELKVSAIIDLYELKHSDRIRFVRLFLESMINAPKDLWHPVLVVIDEIHIFCPEKGKGEAESSVSVIDLASRGRKRGFCLVGATQRPAKLNKDVAAELLNKLTGRTGLDVDMKRAGEELGFTSKADMLGLRNLDPGEFFAFGPAISREVIRFRIGPVKTTHPKIGQRTIEIPKMTDNIKNILLKLSDLPKVAEVDYHDRQSMMKRINDLESELRKKRDSTNDAAFKDFVKSTDEYKKIATDNLEKQKSLNRELSTRLEKISDILNAKFEIPNDVQESMNRIALPKSQLGISIPKDPIISSEDAQSIPINPGERKVLISIAQHTNGATREQIAILTGYKSTSRHTYISRLKSRGFIIVTTDKIFATLEGIDYLGSDYQPLPTGSKLREHLLNTLPDGELKILILLINKFPDTLNRETIGRDTNYKSTSMHTYISRLRSRQLINSDGKGNYKASEKLFD